MTVEQIRNKLFYFSDAAHVLHLDTRSFSEHIALKSTYKSLIDFRDSISEIIMGYQNGKRIGRVKIDELPIYTSESVNEFVKNGISFSYDLQKWAKDKGYPDLENKAQELSGLFAETAYQLTLS
jgi:hypothetical protein